MEHLNQQIVAGHLATQVHAAQIVLSLCAEGAELRQSHHQLAEFLLKLRVSGQGVLQQSAIHLLLDAFHKWLVLQQLHICTKEDKVRLHECAPTKSNRMARIRRIFRCNHEM